MNTFASPEAYLASLFRDSRQRSRSAEIIALRYREYQRKISDLQNLGSSLMNNQLVSRAQTKVLETLSLESYRELLGEMALASVYASAFQWLHGSVSHTRTVGDLPTTYTLKDFPEARETIAATLDGMIATVAEEIERVRPVEMERLSSGVPWAKRLFGSGSPSPRDLDSEPPPVEAQSAILKELVSYKQRLERDAAAIRADSKSALSFYQFEQVIRILDATN